MNSFSSIEHGLNDPHRAHRPSPVDFSARGRLVYAQPDMYSPTAYMQPADYHSYIPDDRMRYPEHLKDVERSRCRRIPYLVRPDIMHTIGPKTFDSVHIDAGTAHMGAFHLLRNGVLSTSIVSERVKLSYPDWELFHHNCQRIVIVLANWKALTEYQLAAFIDAPIQEVRRCLRVLHMSKVVSCVRFWPHAEKFGPIWLHTPTREFRAYLEDMDNLLALCAFGGNDLSAFPEGFNRLSRLTITHDLMAAETCLRLAESGDQVVGVMGEMFAHSSQFYLPDEEAWVRRSHGDGVVVTANGCVIVFEVSSRIEGESGRRIVAKAASWVAAIARSDVDLRVIFIAPDKVGNSGFFSAIAQGVKVDSRNYEPSEYLRERAASHIGVASFRDWFPADNSVSHRASRLIAMSPVDWTYRPFDVPDPEFSDCDTRKNIVVNALVNPATPPWIGKDPSGFTNLNVRRIKNSFDLSGEE